MYCQALTWPTGYLPAKPNCTVTLVFSCVHVYVCMHMHYRHALHDHWYIFYCILELC